MNYRKHGLKALGLSFLAVLGLMAFAAAGAQANATVTVLNASGVGSSLAVTITGKEDNALEGKLEVLNLNLGVVCHKAAASGSLSATGTGLATITFTECDGIDAAGNKCRIDNIVATAKALVFLHGGARYVQFTPDDLLTFAKVLNHTECALPVSTNVKGCVAAKVTTTGHQKEHLISTETLTQFDPVTLFGCELRYGANRAHMVKVNALVALGGAHAGLSWGVE